MATTLTIYDILESELQNKGYNEFVDEEGNWIAFEKEHQFIQKMLSFDEEVASVVNELFFGNSQLDDLEHDKRFKRLFLMKFLDREIAFQSVEMFQSRMVFIFLANEGFIQNVFTDSEKYINSTQTNEQDSTQNTEGTTISDNRNAFADLPQNQVNIDLNDDTLEYASDNTISKNKQANNQENTQKSLGETKNFQLDNLIKSRGLLAPIFEEIDRQCFLQIW